MYDDLPIPAGPIALGGGGVLATTGMLDVPLLAGLAVGLLIAGAAVVLRRQPDTD